jgi:hypothetical protein
LLRSRVLVHLSIFDPSKSFDKTTQKRLFGKKRRKRTLTLEEEEEE